MKDRNVPLGRRSLLKGVSVAVIGIAMAVSTPVLGAASGPSKIGIIGAGKIGSALASLWVKAGHPVMLSSRHPDQLKDLAKSLGPLASVGTVAEAAKYGDVVLVSVPYAALPEVAQEISRDLAGKVVLETGNAFPPGSPLQVATAEKGGTGVVSAQLLPGARLVRAFNKLAAAELPTLSNRKGELAAVPIAADDAGAIKVAEQLVRDAGFEPVLVGPLSTAKRFDMGSTELGREPISAAEMRGKLGLKSP
jgi:hypothetical protein